MRDQGFDQRSKVHVEEDETVVGVVYDIGDLFGEQARVDGVTDRGHARDGVVDLEMPMGIPRQRTNAVLDLDAEGQQHAHQLARAEVGVAVGVAVCAADRQAGDYFSIAVVLPGVLQEP